MNKLLLILGVLLFPYNAAADTCTGTINSAIIWDNGGGAGTCDDVTGSITVGTGSISTEDAYNLVTVDTSVTQIYCDSDGDCSGMDNATSMSNATEFISQETGSELRSDWAGFYVEDDASFKYIIIRHASVGFRLWTAFDGTMDSILVTDSAQCFLAGAGTPAGTVSNVLCLSGDGALYPISIDVAATTTFTNIWSRKVSGSGVVSVHDNSSGADWTGLVSIGGAVEAFTSGQTQVFTNSYIQSHYGSYALYATDVSLVDSVLESGVLSVTGLRWVGGTNLSDGSDIRGFQSFCVDETSASTNTLTDTSLSGCNGASISNFDEDATPPSGSTPAQYGTVDTITASGPKGSLNRPYDFDNISCTAAVAETMVCTFDSAQGFADTDLRLDVVPYIQCGTAAGTPTVSSTKPTNTLGAYHNGATTVAGWKKTVGAAWTGWGDFSFGTTSHSVSLSLPAGDWLCTPCGIDPLEHDFCDTADEQAAVTVTAAAGGGETYQQDHDGTSWQNDYTQP